MADKLYLQIDLGRPLTEGELDFLRLGLRLVAADVAERRAGPIQVRVVGLDYNPCDYQPEGLAAAVAEWAAREFGFPAPEIPVSFDRGRSRYVFAFDQAAPSRADLRRREADPRRPVSDSSQSRLRIEMGRERELCGALLPRHRSCPRIR